MGSLLLQGQHLLLQGGAVQLGSRVLGGHGIQAQAAGNQGSDQDLHLVCSGVVEMTR